MIKILIAAIGFASSICAAQDAEKPQFYERCRAVVRGQAYMTAWNWNSESARCAASANGEFSMQCIELSVRLLNLDWLGVLETCRSFDSEKEIACLLWKRVNEDQRRVSTALNPTDCIDRDDRP